MRKCLSFLLLLALLFTISLCDKKESKKEAEKSVAREKRLEDLCCFVARQYDSRLVIYYPVPNPDHPSELKLESGSSVGSYDTRKNPTGVRTHKGKDLLYVASYGNPKKGITPAIEFFDLNSKASSSEIFVQDSPELNSCYPEDLVLDEIKGIMYVACGVPGAGILKYDLETKKYLGKIVHEHFSALWGLALHQDNLYVSSHCTGVSTGCNPDTQDKIFKVSLKTEAVSPFSSFAKGSGISIGGFGGLDFGPDGNLYVASVYNEDVLKFNPLGSFVQKMSFRHVENPVSVKFYKDKGFVSESSRSLVHEFDLEGNRVILAHPGPLLNSKLMYIEWATCPPFISGSIPKHDEL